MALHVAIAESVLLRRAQAAELSVEDAALVPWAVAVTELRVSASSGDQSRAAVAKRFAQLREAPTRASDDSESVWKRCVEL